MRSKSQRDNQLYIIAGFLGLLISFSQLNLIEILRIDRFQHTFVSAALVIILYFLLSSRTVAQLMMILVFVVGLGLFKELSDPVFDSLDMLANLVGVFLGLMINLASHFKPFGSPTYQRI